MKVRSSDVMPVVCDALNRGQRVRLVATGGSMRPFIRDGDVVELQPCSAPRPGDVVLAKNAPGQYLLHRVFSARGAVFCLSGDALRHREGPFGNESLLGRVVAVDRNGRRRSCEGLAWRAAGLLWTCLSPVTPRALEAALRLRAAARRTLPTWSALFG